MNRLCSLVLILVLLGHQAQAFPKKKQQKLNSVPGDNLKVPPGDPGATIEGPEVSMFTLNPWLSLTLPSNLLQPRLGIPSSRVTPLANQTWAKQMRKQQKLNILNSMPIKNTKDQVKVGGDMISDKFRQQSCGGEFDSNSGTILFPLNGGNYHNNAKCIWIISATHPIEISFTSFNVEPHFDYLVVRDGENNRSPRLAKLSGNRIPSPIETSTNSAYLLFKSDFWTTRPGFQLTWGPTVITTTTVASTTASTTTTVDFTSGTFSESSDDPTTQAPTTAAFTTGTSSESPGGSDCACGQANKTPRIVGGIETEVNEYPWQAALVYKRSTSVFCGASVIGSKHILTAAHCTQAVTDYSINYQVLVGAHGLTTAASSQLRLTPTKFIQHPDYNDRTIDNDVSIIVLSDHINFISSEIRPVCLPDNDADAYDSVIATVSGWGTIKSGGRQPDVLLEVDVPTMTNTRCRKKYGGGITANMLCAGYEEGGKDSCQGDSGGPLIFNSGSGYTQIGVVSFGNGCAEPGYPGVYARVSKYLTWISSKSASSNTCPNA